MTYPHDFSEASPKKCISRSGQGQSSRKNEPEKNFENLSRKNSNKNILDKKSKNFSKKIESKNKTSLSNFKRNNSERASQMNSAVSKPTQFFRFPATWWRPWASWLSGPMKFRPGPYFSPLDRVIMIGNDITLVGLPYGSDLSEPTHHNLRIITFS